MTQNLITLGIVAIFIGFILITLGVLNQQAKADTKSKVAVGGFIGFIPFGFGTDKDMVTYIVAVSLLLVILIYIMPYLIKSL